MLQYVFFHFRSLFLAGGEVCVTLNLKDHYLILQMVSSMCNDAFRRTKTWIQVVVYIPYMGFVTKDYMKSAIYEIGSFTILLCVIFVNTFLFGSKY